MSIWDKFDKEIDVEGLKEDAKEAAKGNFKEVPHGQYEVKITKLEPNVSKKGDPMLTCYMQVLNGEYKGSLVFYNQVISRGVGLHKANEFLRSLDSGIDIKFETMSQYEDLIMDVMEAIDGNLEYAIDYGKNNKGYNTYEIKDVYEVE